MRIRKFAWALGLFMAVGGCDCNKTSAQIQAQKVMVATVLSTPAISIVPQGIAGFDFDASIPFFDGGFPAFDGGCPFDGGCAFDAGSLPISFDGGAITVAPQTALFVFFGNRGMNLTDAPTGVANAMLQAETPAKMWSLKAQEGGTHTLTSGDDSTLKYEPHVDWKFTASAENQTYVGEVQDAPVSERIEQLHPSAGYIDIAAGSDYVLTRPDPEAGQERLLGFVTVFPISAEGGGQQGNVTFTNVPTTPLGFLKLVAAPSEWKTTTVKIPGTAFPEPDRNYVILVQSARVGFSSSDNLFIGSAMIAGVADVGVVKTRK